MNQTIYSKVNIKQRKKDGKLILSMDFGYRKCKSLADSTIQALDDIRSQFEYEFFLRDECERIISEDKKPKANKRGKS